MKKFGLYCRICQWRRESDDRKEVQRLFRAHRDECRGPGDVPGILVRGVGWTPKASELKL